MKQLLILLTCCVRSYDCLFVMSFVTPIYLHQLIMLLYLLFLQLYLLTSYTIHWNLPVFVKYITVFAASFITSSVLQLHLSQHLFSVLCDTCTYFLLTGILSPADVDAVANDMKFATPIPINPFAWWVMTWDHEQHKDVITVFHNFCS